MEFWYHGRSAGITRSVTDYGKVTTFQPIGQLAVAQNPGRLGWGNVIPEEVARTATTILGDTPGQVPASGRVIVTGSAARGYTFTYEP